MNRPAFRLGLGHALVGTLVIAALIAMPAAGGAGPSSEGAHAAATSPVVYPGDGVLVRRASGHLRRLSATSRPFRKFVRHRLDKMWAASGQDPVCARAPGIWVKEYRRSVAFIENEHMNVSGADIERCGGGGAFRFYVKRKGHWKAPIVLGGHEPVRCRILRRWHIPRMNGAEFCLRRGELVPYRP